jgi:pyruvate/2-oxoglutarate dehydrogenase complex dihydrolipoamide acyltransferase (E2) component
VQRTGENLRSYISWWISLCNTMENISPERAIDAFQDGLFRRDFKEELGRCKPKTVDHLMSLANEWADGEDSIATPRSRRRSAERDVDVKDQFHPGSRKKGRRSRYDDAKNTDMVAAGYVHKDPNDSRDLPRRGNNYHGSSSRSNSRDSKPSKEWRRRQP